MDFLNIILIIYLALSLFTLLLCIPKFKSWFYAFKTQKRLKNNKNCKIALVIPAKEESECIGVLLDSINKQTYDKSYFDTYLVVGRDDDPTIEIAKDKLKDCACIVEPNQKCKADALKTLFDHIISTKGYVYDSYIILDADCYLDEHFVEEMNNALSTGADVVIGKKLIKNWQSKNKKNRTLFSNLSALTYSAVDSMGNKYKSDHGEALAMCGQGMMLSNRFVQHFGGFPFHSICEDVEIGIHAILNDFKELYYEHAILYSEEPTGHKDYNKRRYRWLKGYFSCDKQYRKQIVEHTFKKGKVKKQNIRYLYELVPIYLYIITTCIASLTFLTSGIVLAILKSALLTKAFLYALLMIGLIYIILALFNWATINADYKTNKMTLGEKLAVIFIGPAITFEYVIIFFRVINKNYKVNWDHIQRIKNE